MWAHSGLRRSTPARLVATVLLVAGWMTLGCSSAESIDVKPADECFWGAQFADCGGSGTPRFACRPMGLDCAWFMGDVVADGYLAWPCADGRICCEDGPDATYPHDFGIVPASFFGSNGAEPWTRERSLVLDVSIDGPSSGDLEVACEREGSVVDDVAPCRDPEAGSGFMNVYHVFAEMRDTLSVGVRQQDGFSSVGIVVEVVPGASPAATLARVCLQHQSDFVPISCDPTDYPTVECATEGSLRLSAMPSRNQENLSGVLISGDVVFPNGLEVSFTVPL